MRTCGNEAPACSEVALVDVISVVAVVSQSVSQSVFINGDIYRINKLTTTDKALYRFYVADKSVPPIYLRELS